MTYNPVPVDERFANSRRADGRRVGGTLASDV